MSIPEQSGDSFDFCVLFRVYFTGKGAVLMTMNPESAESIQERISALQQEIIDKASCQEDYSDAAQEVLRLREQKEYALQNDT